MSKTHATVTLFAAAAFGHYAVAEFQNAAHGHANPIKTPPTASIVMSSTTASIAKFDTVLGRQVQVASPADFERRFNQR